MEKNKSNLIGGALLLTISGIIVKFLGLIYKVPLSYMLSDEGMGYFNSAYTVYTFFYIICTAGVPKAISILISEAESDGDFAAVKKIYSTAFNLFFSFGIIITALFFLCAPSLSKLIGSNDSMFTMLSIAPSIMFVCASGVIRGYYNGVLKLVPIAVSEVISGVSRLALGLVFAMIGNKLNLDLHIVSALTMLGTTLGSFFSFVYLAVCKKTKISDVNIKQNTKSLSINISKKIIKLALPITLTSAIASISGLIDLTIIMRSLADSGFSELQSGILYGNYTTLAVPLLNLIATLIVPICTVILPIVSKSEIKNNAKLLSYNVTGAFKIVCFISVPISVLFFCNSYGILAILFDDSSAVMAAPLLKLLAPGIFFMCLGTLINTVLEGIGKTKIPLISLSVASVIKFIVSFILIRNSDYGILGAPIGTTLSYAVGFIISAFYLFIFVKVRINFFKPLFSVIISSFIATLISRFITSFLSLNLIVNMVLYLLFFGFFYLILLIVFKFYSYKNILFLAKCTKNK